MSCLRLNSNFVNNPLVEIVTTDMIFRSELFIIFKIRLSTMIPDLNDEIF